MNDTEELWILCSEALREQVSDAIWQAYLSGITPVSIEGGEIVLGVPNTLIRDRVESRFLGLIQDTVTGTVGRDLVVQLEVVAPEPEPEVEWPGANGVEASVVPSSDRPPPPPARDRPYPVPVNDQSGNLGSPVLDPRYTFDTFVIASSNRFAHAAAQSVAEIAGPVLQPPVHLRRRRAGQDPPPPRHRELRAGELQPAAHVRYVTTETFMNEFVDAIRTNDHDSLQAPLPRMRRAPHRRRPVHGAQGGPPGGVLPHLQLPLRRVQADRPHLGPAAQVHRHPGGPPAQPLPVRADHRSCSPRTSRPGWPSSRPRPSTSRSTCPTTCWSSSPPT